MNNNRNLWLVIVANIIVAVCYIGGMLLTGNLLTVIVGLMTVFGLHIAVCCIAGLFFQFRGRRDLANGFFISAAVLLVVPFVFMLF